MEANIEWRGRAVAAVRGRDTPLRQTDCNAARGGDNASWQERLGRAFFE
jgi:hypothetical protein